MTHESTDGDEADNGPEHDQRLPDADSIATFATFEKMPDAPTGDELVANPDLDITAEEFYGDAAPA